MRKETIAESLTAWAYTFENRDFDDGANARRWWARQFEEARDDLARFARSCGLLGFVEIVGAINKTK